MAYLVASVRARVAASAGVVGWCVDCVLKDCENFPPPVAATRGGRAHLDMGAVGARLSPKTLAATNCSAIAFGSLSLYALTTTVVGSNDVSRRSHPEHGAWLMAK